MSLVWTFTVIVPFINGSAYYNDSCVFMGINGVPEQCRNHSYFSKIQFDPDGIYCPSNNCQRMEKRNDCIQFYVQSINRNQYILHEDEVDITGMCHDQIHCSGFDSLNNRPSILSYLTHVLQTVAYSI